VVVIDMLVNHLATESILADLQTCGSSRTIVIWSDFLETIDPSQFGPRKGPIVLLPKSAMPPDRVVLLLQWLLQDPVVPGIEDFANQYRLTRKERQILLHAVRGVSGKDLAVCMRAAPETVRVHISHILTKTGRKGFAQVISLFWHELLGATIFSGLAVPDAIQTRSPLSGAFRSAESPIDSIRR
jgi:DNA-binding CsgD family transcriptional regulator